MQQGILKLIWCLALLAAGFTARSQVIFEGCAKPVIEVKPEASTGLNAVFVAHDLQGVSITFEGANSQTTWQKFSSLGGGYAQPIQGVTTTLRNPEGNMGYIVENGTDRYYFWVVDYSSYPLILSSLQEGEGSDCTSMALTVNGEAKKIEYYSINGRAMELDRGLTLTYETEEYNDSREQFVRARKSNNLTYISPTIHIPAPLCSTQFTLEGDKFLSQWGEGQSVTSDLIQATAVDCYTSATQTERNADNENKNGASGEGLGGSAPAEIEFNAAVTSEAVFTEWQIATDPEFENIDLRFSETQLTYTFRDMGTFYVRFVCANAAGTCEQTGEPYNVQIGESMLQCPNAFSPNDDGNNDEWKVSYRSLISFECHIFNRNGVKIISLTDPSQGWDGKYKGKLVPAGVYFYVIKATGSDGKKYDMGGDINIVNYK